MAEESDDELPANWQSGKTGDGRIFYINHQTQFTQWEHPVTKQVKVIPKGKDSLSWNKHHCFRLELPYGWKEVEGENGRALFVK